MGHPPPDENFPEVVPDCSPQVLTPAKAHQHYANAEGDAKFAVIYESETTTPKYYYDPNQNQALTAVGPGGTSLSPSPAYTSSPAIGYSDPAVLGKKDPESGQASQRICGLRKKVFLILLAVAIVILVAAIGAGVGGGLASKKKQKAAPEAAQNGEPEGDPTSNATSASGAAAEPTPTTATVTVSTDPASISTTSAAAQTTATPAPGTAEPGFNMVAWDRDDFQGKSVELTKVGFVDLPFNSTSYKWHPNGSGCCVTFCLGKSKNVGWRCTDFERKQATSNFDRLFFGCGADASEGNSRCNPS